MATGKTSDSVAPDAISNLAASFVAGTAAKAALTGALTSADYAAGYTGAQTIDANTGTVWSTPVRATAQEDWLRVDLGSLKSIERVRLLPRSGYPELFPAVFTLETSADGSA